jgi:hypothetical protein
MEAWLALARGPLLTFALAVFFLGLLRQVGLTAAELARAYRRAGDRAIPAGTLLRATLAWIIPVRAFHAPRFASALASALFHAGMILVPIFLSGHVQLIQRSVGLAWPTLGSGAADGLTLTTLGALGLLLLLRLADPVTRLLGGFQDWCLPVLCGLPFLSGYFVAHPTASPLPFTCMYFTHLLSGELLLILIPFTKMVHIALFPLTRFAWELGWHFAPGAGEKIRIALGKEGEPV